MDVTRSIPSVVGAASFSFLTTKDIRNMSVKAIVNPVLLDNTNAPTAGGLYDPSLGPMKKDDICQTCHLNSFQCPGHFGHIELPSPVYHPLFMLHMYNLLRGSCLFCHRFKVTEFQLTLFIARLRLLEYGLVREAEELLGEHLQNRTSFLGGDETGTTTKRGAPVSTLPEAGDGDGELHLRSEDDRPPETVPEFKKRINSHVDALIATAIRTGEAKGADKGSAAYAARKAVVSEFMKSVLRRKCERCHAVSPTLRKDGHLKIMERDLSEREKATHAAMNLRRPDAITEANRLYAARSGPRNGVASGSDATNGHDSDEEGSQAESDNAMDVEEEHAERELKEAKKESKEVSLSWRTMPAVECRAHLRLLFDKEQTLCDLIFGSRASSDPSSSTSTASASPDVFFMDVIAVSPTRFRPASVMGETTFENPLNELLTKVIQTSYRVRDFNKKLASFSAKKELEGITEYSSRDEIAAAQALQTRGRTQAYELLLQSLIQLQVDVNSFVDSTKNPTQMAQGRLPPPGVKQALEKKEGLFRKHMMGKRVNYAARSVISPDVNIETNEIGVPPVFARKLTFPEPVTEHNVQRMRQLVINGPDIWPGAVAVRSEDGTETLLAKRTLEERTALANQLLTPQGHNSRQSRGIFGGLGGSTLTPTVNKTVLRHLDNGDVLLLNRQPTLHKPSMMAHKARVLRGEKTIRMHYANCNSYNADFDGDEMNMHFPQSQAARSECYHIANTDNQYLVPTSGNPLRGLIQDHVVAGVWMTCKDSIFTREQYQQLLYGALRPEENYTGHGRVLTLPPAIWRPKPLWTGKQIISTVLLNLKPAHGEGLNMTSKAKVAGRFWGADHASEEQVVFEDGELLCGVLDKSQFGASAYGLVHAVFEIYGPEYAGKLLSILSRLFTKFLQHRAFTCRMDDLMLSEKGDETRRRLLKEGAKEGRKAALKCVGLGDRDPDDLDTDRNLRLRLEEVLREDDKLAALDADMMSSANELTSSVIDSCIPDGLRKRFPHNHMQMMTVSGAKGSPVNVSQISCLLGSQALEGRRVPVMVSGKTLPSFKPFDTSAGAGGFVAGRFLTGLKPHEYYFHCMAGREGLIDTAVKTSRSGYLQRCLIKHLEGITVHYDHTVRNSDGSVLQFHYGEDALDVTKSKYLDQFDFTALNFESFVKRYEPGKLVGVIEAEEAAAHMRKALKKPNKYPPVLSAYSPARHFGATSERFAMDVQKYMDQNPRRLLADSSKRKKKKRKEEAGSELVGGEEVPSAPREPLLRSAKSKIAPEQFRAMSQVLYQRGLVEPGESVGLLAAQGVGEPSTQMTLNTFHFAGHGAANVTLGIPRLREIVMTASQKIKTPIMRLPLREGVSAEQAAKFCKQGSRLLLGQLVDHATVTERVSGKTAENGYERRKTYVVRLQFFPAEEYREEYATTPAEVLGCVEGDFVHVLEKEIIKEQKRLGRDRNQQAKALGQGQRVRDGPGAAGDAEDGEGGVALEDEAVARGVAPSKGSRSKTSTAATPAGRSAAADDQSDSDDDDALQDVEMGDGDADDAKRKERSAAKASYDADSDSDSDSDPDTEDEEAGFEAAFAKAGKPKRSRAADAAGDDEKLALAVEHARENLRTSTKFVQDLQFDVRKGEWVEITLELLTNAEKMLLISVVERACRMSVVNEIPKITRILATPAKGNEKPALTAEGINFRNLWYLAADIVDLDGIYTNDIGALLHTYGVEAARAAIVSEMAGIFKTYGIGVSMRHLYLIADYQTASGGFRPFSRGGIADVASPMLKASFEMTMSFLANAALHGERDNLDGPSANLVVGRPVHSGTGAVGVHVQLPRANVVAA